jgi:hypothetical protein
VQQIKRITYNKRTETNTKTVDFEKTLVFTRQIGHKSDIPGSGQWKIITAQQPGQEPCWVCDRQIYSLIFWNENIGYA